MPRRAVSLVAFSCLFPCLGRPGTIIDRIAVVVGKRVVKDSDIVQDIRVTSFLNREDPDFSLAARKKGASRLIDQELIRQQIQSGAYPVAPESEGVNFLAQIKKDRFPTEEQYRTALAHYGITGAELKDRLLWQLTVLHFIDARFRPQVLVTEDDIRNYYNSHRAALEAKYPKAKSIDDLRPDIIEQITGERVNGLFEDWLKQIRQETRIEYLEKSLA